MVEQEAMRAEGYHSSTRRAAAAAELKQEQAKLAEAQHALKQLGSD